MKNFDQEWEGRRSVEARTFVLCGETFVMRRAIRPEALALRDDIGEDTPLAESMAALDELFISMVQPDGDAEARYRAIRAQDDALGIGDMNEVLDWMIEKATGRPPTSRTDSSPGRGRTGTRSTGGSSSKALSAA